MSSIATESRKSYNIIIVGDGGVGKTTFIKALNGERFNGIYTPTMEFTKHKIELLQNINIIDTVGQGMYDTERMCQESDFKIHCAIVMFDVCKLHCLKNVKKWINKIQKVYGEVPIIIIGNKDDIVCDRKIHNEDIEAEYNDYPYFVCSSKEKTGIKEPIRYIWLHGVFI